MGVTIVIGEACFRVDKDDGEVRPDAAEVELPDAPDVLGDFLTRRTNVRQATWSAWEASLRAVGLHDLFRAPGVGIMRGSSGCMRLLPAHVEEIEAALAGYRAAHPDAVPGWREPVEGGDRGFGPWRPETEGRDPDLGRLVWLAWWTRWAVEHCALPVVAYG